MGLIYAKAFHKKYTRIKHKELRERVQALIIRIQDDPGIGKPLQHNLAGKRSVRIPPFRIIYAIEGDDVILLLLEHRSRVYD